MTSSSTGQEPFSETGMQVVPAAPPAAQDSPGDKPPSLQTSKEFPLNSSYGCTVKPRKKVLLPPPWWEGQLAVGIHKTLRNREKMIDTIKLASPQLHERANVVNFMSNICKQLPFSDTTCHLAVLLLDHFMEKHSIMDYRLKLVALTCLLVAAKMEDRDDYLPSINHLKTLAKLNNLVEYSRENFHKMELYLMKFFDWSVSYPTAAHFIGYYNANCSHLDEMETNFLSPDFPLCLGDMEPETELLKDTESDLCLIDHMDSVCACDCFTGMKDIDLNLPPFSHEQRDSKSFHYQLEGITESLLERALRDCRFLQCPPSLVAAGAVCVARMYLKVSPVWTARLEDISHYTMQNLKPVLELFL